MASKYEMISELYRRTGAGASGSPEAWQAFLSSACRNYKCRFDEQMLIYKSKSGTKNSTVTSDAAARALPFLPPPTTTRPG